MDNQVRIVMSNRWNKMDGREALAGDELTNLWAELSAEVNGGAAESSGDAAMGERFLPMLEGMSFPSASFSNQFHPSSMSFSPMQHQGAAVTPGLPSANGSRSMQHQQQHQQHQQVPLPLVPPHAPQNHPDGTRVWRLPQNLQQQPDLTQHLQQQPDLQQQQQHRQQFAQRLAEIQGAAHSSQALPVVVSPRPGIQMPLDVMLALHGGTAPPLGPQNPAPPVATTNGRSGSGDATTSSGSAGPGPVGGAAGQAGGGGPDEELSIAVRRHQRMQEKNRRSQALYRQRQKASIEGYKRQVEELTAQMGALRVAKAEAEAQAASLRTRNSLLEKVSALRSDTSAAPLGSADAEGPLAESVSDLLSLCHGQPLRLSVQDLNKVDEQGLAKIYQTFIQKMTECLLEGAAENECSPAHDKLIKLVDVGHEAGALLQSSSSRLWVLGNRLVWGHAHNGERGPIPAERWRKTLAAVKLSREQQARLLSSRRQFDRAQGDILARRARLVEELRGSLGLYRDPAQTGWSAIEQSLLGHWALKRSIIEEKTALATFTWMAYNEVFTKVQKALYWVELYPWRGDILGLTTHIAGELGEKLESPLALTSGPGNLSIIQLEGDMLDIVARQGESSTFAAAQQEHRQQRGVVAGAE